MAQAFFLFGPCGGGVRQIRVLGLVVQSSYPNRKGIVLEICQKQKQSPKRKSSVLVL